VAPYPKASPGFLGMTDLATRRVEGTAFPDVQPGPQTRPGQRYQLAP
jgi:hypothetical protein